ncbi:MAG: ABC transporter ATP-binding protein [Suipraeoptans sp.]
MIKTTNLCKAYKGKTVVDNLNLEVNQGEAFALLGSNGAGKSTTIKMILGLVKPNSGEISINDEKGVGYSPESPSFPGFLTGREVLKYYASLQKIEKNEQKEVIPRLLEMVGLEDDRTKVKNYSKGMLQRLALAQSMLGDPEILLLDEPCAGLDAMGRIEMLEILNDLREQGKTIIINSHILSDIERLCQRGIIMGRGKVLRTWSREDLNEETTLENIFTKAIGGAR